MSRYVVKTDTGWYLSKKDVWVSGRESHEVYVAQHRDQALNQMIEKTLKDPSVRCEVVACNANDKGHLMLVVDADVLAREEHQRAFELQQLADTSDTALDAQE